MMAAIEEALVRSGVPLPSIYTERFPTWSRPAPVSGSHERGSPMRHVHTARVVLLIAVLPSWPRASCSRLLRS